jgi:uncharacterized protein YgiM (DUF1202 family)
MLRTFAAALAALFSLAVAPTASAHGLYYVNHYTHSHANSYHGHVYHPHGAHHTVSAHVLNVRSGPSSHHGVIDQLHHGDLVHVLGCNHHNWCQVAYGHHHVGWIYGKYLH